MGTGQIVSLARDRLSDAVGRNRAKLEGCILGAYTKVGAKADLSRCITQPGYDVAAGGEPLRIIFAVICTDAMIRKRQS